MNRDKSIFCEKKKIHVLFIFFEGFLNICHLILSVGLQVQTLQIQLLQGKILNGEGAEMALR